VRRPLALREVTPPAPAPVAFEEAVHEAERLAGAGWVLASFLEDSTGEVEATWAAQLLVHGLERQAKLLRLFMYRPDDPAEAPEQRG